MKIFLIALVFFYLQCFGVFAERINTFRLDHLSNSDGLPNSSVSAILQDSKGFIWIGTQSGLSKYNGYNFETYYNDPFNNNSIPHNLIQTMFFDNDILWLGTYNGLCRFEITTNSFKNYPSYDENEETSLSNDVVVAIEKDNKGRLWVGTLNGLNLFDEKKGTFKKFFNIEDDPFSLPDNTVRSILLDSNDNLWVGTYGGLSLWNDDTQTFKNFSYNKSDLESIPSNYVMDIKQSPQNKDILLIGTWEGKDSPGGFAEFNTKTYKSVSYDIPDKRVYKILADKNNRIWIGTWGGGLVVFSPEDSSYQHYIHGSSSDLSHNIIYSLFEDLSGDIWIGTNGGGINKFVEWKNQFYLNLKC